MKHIISITLTADTIYHDPCFFGTVTLRYKPYPKKISKNESDSPIDIPRELESLLPLLCASYVWLDDNPERSQYYLELYNAEAALIKRRFPARLEGFRDVTGWA